MAHLVRILIYTAITPLVTAQANAQDVLIQKREGEAWKHTFYSGQYANPDNFISYIVCNRTDLESDFFWSGAGFGISETDPMAGHQCLRRDDYISLRDGTDAPDPQFDLVSAYVRDEAGADIPTLFWCDFRGIDRCGNSLLERAAAWITTLRIAGSGPTDEVEIVSTTSLSDGGYRIEIEYSEPLRGLIAVARNTEVEAASFVDGDGQPLEFTALGEIISLGERPISRGLQENDAAIIIPSTEESGGFFSFVFESLDGSRASVSLIGTDGNTPTLRLDGIGLDPRG